MKRQQLQRRATWLAFAHLSILCGLLVGALEAESALGNEIRVTQTDLERFRQLAEQQLCIGRLARPTAEFTLQMNLWYTNGESKTHIPEIVRAFEKRSAQVLSELEVYAASIKDVPSDVESIRSMIEAIHTDKRNFKERLSAHHTTDLLDIEKLDRAATRNAELRADLVKAGMSCSQSTSTLKMVASTERMISVLARWNETLIEARGVMAQASQKRFYIFEQVQTTQLENLKKRFAELTGVKVAEAAKEIQASFGTLDILTDLTLWWSNANLQGTARGMVARYFQFNDARAILATDLEQLDFFQARLDLSGAHPDTKEIVQNKINVNRKFLLNAQKEVDAAGWAGFVDKQRTQIGRWTPLLPQMVEACARAIAAWKKVDEKPGTQGPQKFHLLDRLYIDVVENCRRGQRS